jgi:G patch domain-containing protein 1
VSAGARIHLAAEEEHLAFDAEDVETLNQGQSLPPPQYPASEASSSRPPPFSSLYASPSLAPDDTDGDYRRDVLDAGASTRSAAPAYAAVAFGPSDSDSSSKAFYDPVAETKHALPRDTKGECSRKDDDAEPPPAYSEGSSPIHSFAYLMAAAGGASSIITQVQQGGPGPVNAIGGTSLSFAPILMTMKC